MKPRVGISSCLLGYEVRHDGGHKRDSFLVDALSPVVEWVSVCPEIEIGLGTPRPTIDLQQTPGGIRLVMPEIGRDLTEEMRAYAERRIDALRAIGLSGYVLKARSPSCGISNTKVYDEAGVLMHHEGTGLFAAVLRERMAGLPVEQETTLTDRARLEDFLRRVREYRPARTV
jgi:uncharacterized protein YbbK (DUF523 family)